MRCVYLDDSAQPGAHRRRRCGRRADLRLCADRCGGFADTYTQYLDLQAQQGFDLTKYRGKRVKRYTYAVTNYPTGESGVQAGLLLYRNTVIGGDVLSNALGGFIHGLTMPT